METPISKSQKRAMDLVGDSLMENNKQIDQREAAEFAMLTARHGVHFRLEEARLRHGTFGLADGNRQIWKLTGDKCTPPEYMLEFGDPWAARRKAIEIMRALGAE